MKDFLLDIEKRLAGSQGVLKDLTHPDSFPLMPGQAIYIFNWGSDSVCYQRGIKELLGYGKEEFTKDLITSYFHPDDSEVVLRLVKSAVNFATSNPVSIQDFQLDLTFRIRKKNGEYIKVLRQTGMFELSTNSRLIRNYSMISDISFMDTGNKVEWHVRAEKLIKKEFKKHMHEAYKDFFSTREKEILAKLKIGNSSKQIAGKLYISSHTVDTHRRKMLRKSGCSNTVELLNFAKRNVNL